MLVSKQYLDEAVRTYSQQNVFRFSYSTDIGTCINGRPGKESVNCELFKSVSAIQMDKISGFGISPIKQLPGLRILKVTLREFDLELDDKVPWLHDYSDLDIVQLTMVKLLLALRGLRQVTVLRERPIRERPPAEVQKI